MVQNSLTCFEPTNMKRIMLLITLLVTLLSTSVLAATPPKDVPKTHWAYQAILKVLDSGLMEGYPDGTFRGQQSVDRYEMAIMVARLIDTLEGIEKEYNAKLEKTTKSSSPVPSAPQQDNPMLQEVLSLISQLQVEFETELKEINDRYYTIKLDYGKLEEALQNLESGQQSLARRIDNQQLEIDDVKQRMASINDTRNEVDSLRKEVASLKKETTQQAKSIKSLYIALGVMGAVVLLVGLK